MTTAEIKEALSPPCVSCEEIDDALRSYLAAATAGKGLLVNKFPATADARSGPSASGGVYCTLRLRIKCIQHIYRSWRLREAAVCLCITTGISTTMRYGDPAVRLTGGRPRSTVPGRRVLNVRRQKQRANVRNDARGRHISEAIGAHRGMERCEEPTAPTDAAHPTLRDGANAAINTRRPKYYQRHVAEAD